MNRAKNRPNPKPFFLKLLKSPFSYSSVQNHKHSDDRVIGTDTLLNVLIAVCFQSLAEFLVCIFRALVGRVFFQ